MVDIFDIYFYTKLKLKYRHFQVTISPRKAFLLSIKVQGINLLWLGYVKLLVHRKNIDFKHRHRI